MAKAKDFKDLKSIPMVVREYNKVGSQWHEASRRRSLISENAHKNMTSDSTIKRFRRMGGYERNEECCTARGNAVVRNTSISPDKSTKIVREFDMNNLGYVRAYRNRRSKARK